MKWDFCQLDSLMCNDLQSKVLEARKKSTEYLAETINFKMEIYMLKRTISAKCAIVKAKEEAE